VIVEIEIAIGIEIGATGESIDKDPDFDFEGRMMELRRMN